MNIQASIRERVNQLPVGKVFGYPALSADGQSPAATAKAASRLVQAGELRRLSKGRFYRPEQGVLGERELTENEKLKSLLYKDGQRTGYVTGPRLYNRLGLSTQLSKTVTIAWMGSRQTKRLGTLDIKLIPSRAPVSESDRPLLELLDALKDIRKVPDARPPRILDILESYIDRLSPTDRVRMTQLAIAYYPPATRALLGLVFDVCGLGDLQALRSSLNPFTRYRTGLSTSRWAPSAANWNIL